MENKVKELLGDRFESELQRVINEFAGMISKESAIRILAHENGLIKNEKRKIEKINEILEMNDENNVNRSVDTKLKLIRKFQKLETKSHVLQRILLRDDDGKEIMCVLWDEKINDFEMLIPEENDLIIISNAYIKNNEIHLGRYSKINIEKEKPILPLSKIRDGTCNVVVKLLGDINYRTFTKNNEDRKMGTTMVGDSTGNVKIVFWGESCNKVENAIKGDILLLNKAVFRNAELHVNDYTDIKINPPNFIIISPIEDVLSGFEGSFEGKLIAVNIIQDKNFGAVRTESKDIKVLFNDDMELEKELSPDIDKRTITYLHLRSYLGKKCILTGYMDKNLVFNCKHVKKME